MTRIIMCGCNGAMGRMITGIVNEDAEAEIVAGIDMVDTKEHCYPVFQKLADCDVEADALIDFSTPKILDDILTFSKEKKVPVDAAKVFATEGFDVEIVEKHHNQKLDAPSGTALALADSINEAMGNPYEYVYDRSQRRQKRDKKELGISAVRGGTIVGEHDVIFAGKDEVITFSHTAYSKAVFGKGAVAAAKFLKGKTVGRYEMADVIAAN